MHDKRNPSELTWPPLLSMLLAAALGAAGCGSIAAEPRSSTSTTASTTAPATVPTTTPAAASTGSDADLGRRVDTHLPATGATAAVRVIELPSRREIYAREADRPLMPASNMKLVTTAMALDRFGPGHTF